MFLGLKELFGISFNCSVYFWFLQFFFLSKQEINPLKLKNFIQSKKNIYNFRCTCELSINALISNITSCGDLMGACRLCHTLRRQEIRGVCLYSPHTDVIVQAVNYAMETFWGGKINPPYFTIIFACTTCLYSISLNNSFLCSLINVS